MNTTFIALFITLGLTIVNPTTAIGNSPTYLFEMFLENKLETFPAWISANNLDPSPINPSELILLTYSVTPRYTFKIKNEQISGYASATNDVSISVEVDLKRQFFYVTYSTKGSLKFHGDYSINGTNSFPERPLIGEGAWIYSINGTLTEDFKYRFNIKPNGYLDVSRDIQEYTALLTGESEERNVEFNGYLEETADLIEYDKERIRTNFQKAFDDQRIQNAYPEHPTARLVHTFLTEVFQNTHYLDIISDQSNPTTEKDEVPTDEPLKGQSNQFKLSFMLFLFTMISVMCFQ